MGFFTFLAPKKRNPFAGAGAAAAASREAEASPPSTPHYSIRPELMDAVKFAVASILETNFLMMDVASGELPLSTGTRAMRSRGYLLGLAIATLAQFEVLNPTDDEFIGALAIAFAAAHGRTDSTIALETMDMHTMGDVDVGAGVALALRDVNAIYGGEAWMSPTGLWLIHHGDEAAIQINLAGLDAELPVAAS